MAMGNRRTRTARMGAALVVAALTLTACGSNDSDADAASDDAEHGLAGLTQDDPIEAEPEDGVAERSTNESFATDAEAPAAGDGSLDDGSVASDIAEPPAPDPGGIESVVFADHGVSGWIDTAQQPFSTFQTDADVASYRLASSWLASGVLPPAEGIRAEEWINAIDHDHPAPTDGQVWRISADAGAPWWQSGPDSPANTRLLRVGLRATETATRPPASITFVVDVSGSMSHDDRLGAVVDVISDLLTHLDDRDQVGVVTFSDDAEVLIEHTNDHGRIRDALAGLSPQAYTNTGAGVLLGHEQAAAAHRQGDNSSVVVLADGLANRGIVDPDRIISALDRIEGPARIVTHTVGIGREVYNDAMLERLANVSGGTFAYVDGPQHTDRLLTRDLPLLNPVAHDVKAQVEFDPAVVRSWRLIGYENRLISAEDFRDDAVLGAYIGAGHAVTAVFEVDVQTEGTSSGPLGEVAVRWADPDTGATSETVAVLDASLVSADATSATWAAAAGMTTLVEALRGSPHALVNLEQTAERLEQAGSEQDRALAQVVRDAASAYQAASPQRQQATTP